MASGTHYVYFAAQLEPSTIPDLEVMVNFYKIGRTQCYIEREKSLQTGSPYQVVMHLVLEYESHKEAVQAETRFHHRLFKDRARGEWFRYTENTLELFQDICNETNVVRGFNSHDKYGVPRAN